MKHIQITLPSTHLKWFPLLTLSIPLAIGLFVVMQLLISPRDINVDKQDELQSLEYVRVIHNEKIREKARELPPKQKEASTPPPRPQLDPLLADAPKPTPIKTPQLNLAVNINQQIGLAGLLTGGSDGKVIPLVKIPPSYPRQARAKGIEGWVKVGIKISETGSVLDVEILEAEPRKIFDRAAVRSVFRWKFKPEIVDGNAIENYSTQMIHFQLDKKK